jgi:hypothetical protein
MTHHDLSHEPNGARGSFWTSRSGLVLLAFLVIGGTLLLTEHRAHVLGYLPFLFLLACPLLHMFGHGGHGGHASHERSDQTGADPRESTETRYSSKGEKP